MDVNPAHNNYEVDAGAMEEWMLIIGTGMPGHEKVKKDCLRALRDW